MATACIFEIETHQQMFGTTSQRHPGNPDHATVRSYFDCNICGQSKVVPPQKFFHNRTWFLKTKEGRTEIPALKGKEIWNCMACGKTHYHPVTGLVGVEDRGMFCVTARFKIKEENVVFVVEKPDHELQRSYLCEEKSTIYFL